jgi:hypothetical protein
VRHIDPFPNDDPEENRLPWYWTEAERREFIRENTMTFEILPAF